MTTPVWNVDTLRQLLEEAVEGGPSQTGPAIHNVEHQLSAWRLSKRERPAIARAATRYLNESYGSPESVEQDGVFCSFLTRTRLAIHSVPLRQAMIAWVDEYFEGKKSVSKQAVANLLVLIVMEGEAKRLQYYSIHEAPGSTILQSRKRIVSCTVHPWALEAAKRWLPRVREHFIDRWLWSLLMHLFRVLPNDVYHEAEHLLDFRRLLRRHPKWGSKRTIWAMSVLRPEPDWLRRVGRLSERGYRTYKSYFVSF